MALTTTEGPQRPGAETQFAAGVPAVAEDSALVPLSLPAGAHPRPEEGRGATTVLGALLVVAADAMVLVAFVAVYFSIRSGAPSWPPEGVNLGTYIPTTVTITAVMSSFSVAWAISAFRRHDQRNATCAIILTIVFGLAMVNAQVYALSKAGFGVGQHAYSTLYYLLVGYHIANVVVGIVLLIVVGARGLAGHFRTDDYQPARAAAFFWHYGCAAWYVVVTVLFLMSPHAK